MHGTWGRACYTPSEHHSHVPVFYSDISLLTSLCLYTLRLSCPCPCDVTCEMLMVIINGQWLLHSLKSDGAMIYWGKRKPLLLIVTSWSKHVEEEIACKAARRQKE
eukprot:773837-Pelagomonas_calceolata.AAC.3